MPASSSSSDLRIAMNALVLVERGFSERSAVARAVRNESMHAGLQGRALKLVTGTVAEQDLLDKIVLSALPAAKLPLPFRCLARLTAWISTRENGAHASDVVTRLRTLAPPDFRPDLEYLLGYLQTIDVNKLFDGLSDPKRIALQTHQRCWWVDYCFRMLGRGEAIRLFSSPPRPRYVRLNSLRNSGRTSLPGDATGLSVLESVESFPGIYRLTGSSSSLSSQFANGLFQFQDLASYAAVLAGEPSPGDSVMDLCGAPGAKTCALAQLMRNKGTIISVDYSRPRMKTWKRELDRLGVKIGIPVIGDASRLGIVAKHDLVLLDPPCSGTGIFDRNPRMKWHLTPERVERYSQLQSGMLEEAHRLLAPDGRLVYCTCSLTVEENEGVVSSFLRTHSEMETRPLPLSGGLSSPGLNGLTDCRRFYPHVDRTAGYFIARIENTS